MTLSVIDDHAIDAGKDCGAAFDYEVYQANLYDNYQGVGGDNPANIIKTYHATTSAWRTTLRGVIDAHDAESTPVSGYDECEEAYLVAFGTTWGQEPQMNPILDPTGVFRAKREALLRFIALLDGS